MKTKTDTPTIITLVGLGSLIFYQLFLNPNVVNQVSQGISGCCGK